MTCMRRCPAEAIRVIRGKAVIADELCVDCGTCISVCPSKAVVAISDIFEGLKKYKYKVAIPSPVLYSQFEPSIHPYIIHMALKQLGFDKVVDIFFASDTLSVVIEKYMDDFKGRLPRISSHCPATVRLIQVKYPDLVELVVTLDAPREITAREIKENLPIELGMDPDDIAVVYISPCPAKIVSIKQPAEKARSWFDGTVSMNDVYSLLFPHVIGIKETFDISMVPDDFYFSADFTTFAGKNWSSRIGNRLVVTGVDHVMKIFDDIENSRLRNVNFVEALTCMQGCVGGPFAPENPYIARSNSYKQKSLYENIADLDERKIIDQYKNGYYNLENPVLPRPTKYFDGDLVTSIKRMKEKNKVYQKLPQIDCGCCGAPTCIAFAEDFVRGETELMNCIFLSQKVNLNNWADRENNQ